MAASKSITPETLAALGAPALAAALIEHAQGDPVLRKKLRMLLAGARGSDTLAAELGKRIQVIGRSRAVVDWDRLKPLVQELEHIRTTIGTTLAAHSPAAAIERLWDFVGVADLVINRVGDGVGQVEDVFDEAMADLGRLVAADSRRDIPSLARRVLALCEGDGFWSDGKAIEPFSDALGASGRATIRQATEAALAALPDRQSGGANPRWRLTRRLTILADLEHDPDAYLAALRAEGSEERHGDDIARRLIDAARPGEALQWLERPGQTTDGADVDLRIEALAALGRADEAQALRWATFEEILSIDHLRAYLKGLPDFEDFEAEQKALDLASRHEAADLALEFLVGWPALERAARLVRERLDDLDGEAYYALRPAARALEDKYPDAAIRLYRRLAESVLDRAASRLYPHAVRDLEAAAGLDSRIPPETGIEREALYISRLRALHGRKHAFWALMDPKIR
jgi:hypothetical protein